MKYQKFNEDIIKLVGGKDNITSITHCVTRLRFKLKDKSKAKTNEIKNTDGVIDVVSNDVAYQIIIGTHVTDVYEELVSMLDMKDSSGGAQEKPKGIKGYLSAALSAIAETINPFIDILMAAGLISAFLTILTLLNVLTTESSTYIIFDSIKSGIFTFLPILIAAGFAKRANISQYLAMALAFTLVMPTIDGVEGLTLFGISLQTISYSGTFIPVLLGVWVLSLIVKLLQRYIPKSLHYFLVPALSLVLTLPIVLFIFGPIGNLIGSGLDAIFVFIMDTFGAWLATAFYAAIHPFIMITGAGAFTVPITLNNLANLGFDQAMLPGGLVADVAIAGSVVGYLILTRIMLKKQKSEEKEREAELFAVTGFSAVMGITEPALYGVFAKYRKPFISTLIGSVAGGLISGLAGVKTYGYVWGLFSIPTYLTGGVNNMVWIIVACVVAFAVSLAMAIILGFPKENKNLVAEESTSETDSEAFGRIAVGKVADGEVVPLSSVCDQAFASEALGKGIAIVPTEQITKIYAPVSGEIVTVFPTKHAYGILTKEGIEVLIHIGVDTVNLDGKGFESFVKQGQQIEAGNVMAEVDIKKIKDEDFDPTIMVVVTNTKDFLDVISAGNDTDDSLYVLI